MRASLVGNRKAWATLLVLVGACSDRVSESEPTRAAPHALSTVPVVSSEIETDPPILGPSDEAQHNPAAATNGAGYFVVWDDARGGMFGTRVDASGQVLDKTGIMIGPGSWNFPDVAFDGASYVVTWGSDGPTPAALAVRVQSDGTVLDDPPLTIAPSGGGPRITRGAGGSLVVWNEWLGASLAIQARRLGQDGTLLGTVVKVASDASEPDVAFDGSVYLIAWVNSGGVRAARLTSTGALLDSTPITIASSSTVAARPTVTSGSTGFAVSWREGLSYPGSTRIARVAADGTVLDPGGIGVPNSADRADVGFDGTWFLAVFMGAGVNDVFGIRFTPNGAFQDAAPFPISSGSDSQETPRVASRSGEHLVVWSSSSWSAGPDISGRRITADGSLLGSEQITLAYGANRQMRPAVASDGTDFLLVWQDYRGEKRPDLHAERIAADGSVLDPQGIPLVLANDGQEEPAVAFDGAHYVLVWQDRRNGGLDIYGARIDKNGQILDAQGFLVGGSSKQDALPAVASNGSVSFVAWQIGGYIINPSLPKIYETDVRAARLSSDGTVLDPIPLVISDDPGQQGAPDVACDGKDFFVVWSDPSSEIRGARYGGDGTLLSPSVLVVASGPGARAGPRVAFGGGTYLVVWADDRNAASSSSEADIYAARVSPDGVVLDPNGIRISDGPVTEAWADVTYSGGVFVVAWSAETDKGAARVDLSGKLLDPGGFELSPDGAWGEELALGANSLGTSLVGYERYDGAAAYRSYRVKARSIAFVAAPDSGDAADASDAAPNDASGAADGNAPNDADHLDAVAAAGAAGDGAAAAPGGDDADGGCGCRAPGSDPALPNPVVLALVLGLVIGGAAANARRSTRSTAP